MQNLRLLGIQDSSKASFASFATAAATCIPGLRSKVGDVFCLQRVADLTTSMYPPPGLISRSGKQLYQLISEGI